METINLTRTRQRPLTSSHKIPLASKIIYLDNNATTPVDPIVLDTMLPYLKENFGNPASTHSYGERALYAVDQARHQVATAIHADDKEIIFTSGATESNNFVVKGVFDHYRTKKPHFIVSNVEHKCILEAVKHVKKQGAQVTILKVNKQGLIQPEQLSKAIRPNTVLVSIMFANNEIGSINPIKELAKICRKHNILFHTDASQAVGKLPINVHELGIDLLSASGHKFYGPKGIGFAYVREGAEKFLTPLLDGGGQEGSLRSGTLNVPGIVGLGKAIEITSENMDSELWFYLRLRNRLYDQLIKAFPDMIVNGPEVVSIESLEKSGDLITMASTLKRLPNNLNITIPSVDVSSIKEIYDVAFSSTSACSSGTQEPSYVLMSIGRNADQAMASLRFGIGRFNTQEDVDDAAASLIETLL